MSNKVQLHFTWENGIDAEPTLYTINVDLLRADTSLSGNDEAVRLEVLSVIDGDKDYLESTLMNKIWKAEDEGDFNLGKYSVKDDIRCITLESCQEP
jgi:hypothetical protein